jgi:hypothetical protein
LEVGQLTLYSNKLLAGQAAQAMIFLFAAMSVSETHFASYAMDFGVCMEYETHHLSPPSTELKNAQNFTSILTTCLNGVVLTHRGNFTSLNYKTISLLHIPQIYLKTKHHLISSMLVRKQLNPKK